ncbi:class I SAM-dependent methyltransferase [Dactylosporangium cerinum]|uniref:Class I SAM-dependent methyltransferase n=1 Tax=Dactylosporangium cerinum TaxID=1434730 RepID=A0ABV9VSE5_9ACTN
MNRPIFTSTAEYYAQFRPAYPAAMLDDLVRLSVGTHGRHVVDLGCGTGEVALPLSRAFDTVTAIDADPAMVALARRKADRQAIGNVTWLVGPAETLELADGSADLVVAGSSFHWMDRRLLSARARDWLTGTGVVAVLGGGSDVWDVRTEWHAVAVRTIQRYLGQERRAGNQAFGVTGRHGDFLTEAGFSLRTRQYETETVWTTDRIVGYLYSTSFASPAVLGDQRDAFERDLRQGLHELSPGGTFPEVLSFYSIVGRREPDGAHASAGADNPADAG